VYHAPGSIDPHNRADPDGRLASRPEEELVRGRRAQLGGNDATDGGLFAGHVEI
jgi:hypothetical protein